ncbi:ComF family protein [Herminiimonas aquatilis]|uniref:ComF family protein n=1 Tax=Herminiimonas aquatilis TaxID=345342 RepID=A0ABW2J6N1_9BURK
MSNPPAFDATIVASDYTAPVDQLVLALKFGNRLALAPLFARKLRDAILREPAFAMPALLAAVPLSEKRLAERGFNQALEIAKPLARAIAIPLAPQLIERTRDTLMQAMLPTAERHRNIRHAFALPANAIKFVRGQHIGLVDDVLTTGETLNEIAATLKRHGAVRITNLVFARTPYK